MVMGGALSAAAITVAYFAGGSNGGSEIVTGLVSVKIPTWKWARFCLSSIWEFTRSRLRCKEN